MRISTAFRRTREFLERQLAFDFTFGRRLVKSRAFKRGVIWIRPDGKQKPCPTIRALVAAVMDWDGHLLPSLIAQAQRIRGQA